MSDYPNPFIPPVPEVDRYGGDDLPTYEDLAAENGPNSRFGRWKGWIEKRAAERYADLTQEDLRRRRQRGWGDGVQNQSVQSEVPGGPANAPQIRLQIQTNLSVPISPPGPLPSPPSEPLEPQPSIGEVLSPTRLRLHHFGSRFLPHTTSPIRCLLPVLGDSLLLIGHDEGLSVLNMFPKEWSDEGLLKKGPNDAVAHHIWTGEGVYQMSLLEAESTGDGTPQGVVLALIGPSGDSPKEQEGIRTIRMYNLASLVSLAKWASVQQPGSVPLRINDLSSSKSSQGRHHRSRQSLAKGLKNLKLDSSTSQSGYGSQLQPSYPSAGIYSPQDSKRRGSSDSTTTIDSSWDIVEDLPLRWATDYVSLASQGSRLYNTPVLFYDIWRDPNERNRGITYLAVVVKSNILLYQTPKGERAFRFVKEFYTPLTPRNITFIQQSVQDVMGRSPSDASPRYRGHSQNLLRHGKGMSMGNASQLYPAQLSLFVIFEKKAGLIRVADAAVGEVDLYDEIRNESSSFSLSPSTSNSSLGRRNRASWDGRGFVKDMKAPWAPPCKVDLSSPARRVSFSQNMYILTRGKQSQILPYPLPANLSHIPPYRTLHWSSPPSSICTRVCHPPDDSPPFLQVIAFGEDGVEVQELSLSTLSERKGKGRAEDVILAQTDVGGADAGYLAPGGHWHTTFPDRGQSPYMDYGQSDFDDYDDDDFSLEELKVSLRAEQGVYGWVRKGAEDWRIFWMGGSGVDTDSETNDR